MNQMKIIMVLHDNDKKIEKEYPYTGNFNEIEESILNFSNLYKDVINKNPFSYLETFIQYIDGTIEIVENDNLFSWDKIWSSQAEIMANFSKCQAYKVASLIIYKKSIISSGVNGTIPGQKNCSDLFRKINGKWYQFTDEKNLILCKDQDSHHNWSNYHEIHAEMNAILNLPVRIDELDKDQLKMFVTHTPCFNCAKAIAQSGIKEVHILHPYKDDKETLEFFNENNISVIKEESYKGL